MKELKIYAAQLNPTVGNLQGNFNLIKQAYEAGVKQGANIVITPELALTGYSPEDLLLMPAFLDEVQIFNQQLASLTGDVALIFTSVNHKTGEHPTQTEDGVPVSGQAFNSAFYCLNGKVQQVINKTDLPNFGVFDEKRHFQSETKQQIITFNGINIGIPICRDIWLPQVCANLKKLGAEIFLSPNASPYAYGKIKDRIKAASNRATENNCPILYLALVGGQDETVMDGRSFAINPNSKKPVQTMLPWQEDATMFTLVKNKTWQFKEGNIAKETSCFEEDVFSAVTLGLKDYIHKNGFKNVVLGISGGIDSALVAAIAVKALGSENVTGVTLSSPFTSKESITDAKDLAKSLNIKLKHTQIEPAMQAIESVFSEAMNEVPKGLTHENIQARLRGLTLMAISNQTGALLLSTGNKSETAVGYCTMYGDMAGAFNPIKDIYKTDVFKICKWLGNIPKNIINKAPTAELRDNQKDEDSLPPYETLDQILKLAIEARNSSNQIIAKGFNAEQVNKVMHLLKISEYKRKQAAPGTKTTTCTFGREWRMPLTSKYQI